MGGLDFWIGDWDASWDGGTGRNRITREYDGHVVVERFEAGPPEPFTGFSLSVADAEGTGWRQTWVDSTGNYWAFLGGPKPDGSFVFATPNRVDADNVWKRMIFANIEPDTFDWRWESSMDEQEWIPRWEISYRRRRP